jgi:hypothetical protein
VYKNTGGFKMGFAIPPFEHIKFALTVQLGCPFNSSQNLVVFFTGPSEINWNVVEGLIENPDKHFLSATLSDSPWNYRCCDYTVGTFLGLIEILTKKKFKKISCPVQDIGTNYYELAVPSTELIVQTKELQTT